VGQGGHRENWGCAPGVEPLVAAEVEPLAGVDMLDAPLPSRPWATLAKSLWLSEELLHGCRREVLLSFWGHLQAEPGIKR